MTRVLLIDDDEMVRKLLRRALRKWGHELAGEADNGLDGLKIAAETSPDFVIIDCSMPGMDGIETTKRLLADAPGLKVVAYSGDIENEPLMREAGALDFVQKGRSIDAVREVLELNS